MSEEAEKDDSQAEDLPMNTQEKKKLLQDLRQEMKELQAGTTLANTEQDAQRINEKYREAFDEYNHKVAEHEQRLRERQKRLPIDYTTLPFRKSLEDAGGSELIAYIMQNLPWLRLIMLLYGGISDQGLATYVIQYDEITARLQLEEEQRLYHINQLRQRDYWEKSWNTAEDVVYTLAVYLDTECGKLAKQAEKYVPEFTPHAIFNDSPFTPLILNTLRQRKPPATLKTRFWQEWHTRGQEMRRVHALLALLLIDTEKAIATLIQSLNTPTTFALAELVLNQLRLRKHTLADALIILSKKAEIGKSLAPLQNTLEDDQWGDMVELFFRTFASVTPIPIKYDDILLNHALSIPRINAEVWLYWLSGFEDDSSYTYALALDNISKNSKPNTALINIQSAYNRKYDALTQWYLLAIPPIYTSDADIVGDTLTIAYHSRSDVMKELFYIGAMAYTGVNAKDYPGLKDDMLAAALLIPFDFQKDLIAELDPELAEMPMHEFVDQIIERVWSIKDPVIKARALWRVAQYRSTWKNFNLWNIAIEAAEKISDPLQRSRALERLINHVPMKLQERFKHEALVAARNINDPNNRARALARLALYENNEKHWSLLSEALTTIETVSSEKLRIDTLQLIYPYLIEDSQLVQKSNEIIKNIKSDWYRNKGNNLLSLKLVSFHDQLYQPAKLTPVLLAAFIDDILALKPQQAEREDLWSQLLDSTKREHALSTLLKTASANDLNGLYLTTKASEVIQRLLASKEISAIYILLPYLRGVEPALLPLLNTWVNTPPDEIVWAYAGLLLAEAGQIDENTLPCLLELMKKGSDFGRYRASILLHGSLVFIEKKNRTFRTSQLGIQALLLLAQAHEQVLSEKVQLATPIAWTWYNLIHDDPSIFQQLIHHANSEEGAESGVPHLLRNIFYCDASCLNEFVKQFEVGSEKIQELLLHSWSILSRKYFQENITSDQTTRMDQAIRKLPQRILDNFAVIPQRLNTITHLLTSVAEKIKGKEIILQQAPSILNQELSSLSLRLPDTLLEEFGEHIYYLIDSDPQQVINSAQIISEDSTSLELLFTWLAASLREDLNDSPSMYHRTSTLLELAGATTQFSPAAMYTLIEKNDMGHLLIQAIMYHKSFWGRAGAATLLAYLRQTPEAFEDALLCGIEDVAMVQTAIIATAQKLRYLDEQMIAKLVKRLEDENASVVYTVALLLTNIARNENSSYLTRQIIANSLSKAIQHIDSARPVFLLGNESTSMFIRNIGRLDHQLYKAIIDIIGII